MTVAVDARIGPATYRERLRADVREGLTARPKSLPSKYFYDARGSELFDEITRLPEYYPTRTERGILVERAGEIAELTQAEALVELGSGTSEKTRLLLSALYERGTLRHFVPIDVDSSVLASAGRAIASAYPGVDVQAVVADFEEHLDAVPPVGRRLVAFLGSTIGNLEPPGRARFLREVRAALGPDEAFLLGTDLVKSRERLLAAYDDASGVTAAFNRNILAVLNRELGADFSLDEFDHVARWDPDAEWIEMRLRARGAQLVTVRDLGLRVRFEAGEEMRTEISAKFTAERVADELAAAGLRVARWWTDAAGDFALSLSVPAGSAAGKVNLSSTPHARQSGRV